MATSDDVWVWGKDKEQRAESKPRVSRGFVRVPVAYPRKDISEEELSRPSASQKSVTDTKAEKTPSLPQGRTLGLFNKLKCKFGGVRLLEIVRIVIIVKLVNGMEVIK